MQGLSGNLNTPLLLFTPIHLAVFLYFAPGSAFDLTSKGYLVGYFFILMYLVEYFFILMYLVGYFFILMYLVGYFFILMYLVGYFITLTYLAGHMPAPSPGTSRSSSNSSCALSSFGIGTTSDFDCFDFNVDIFCLRQDMVLEGFDILVVLWIHILLCTPHLLKVTLVLKIS